MHKILFIIPNLSAGGAEKVMSFLAQNISKENFKVKLVVIGYKKDTAYDVSNIETIYLNKAHVSKAFNSILKLVHSEKPDLVLSSLSHLNAIMGYISFLTPKTIFIGRETIVHSAQQVFTGNASLKSKIIDLIYYFGYKGLRKLISQSQDMKNDLVEKQGFKNDKIVTINNPVSLNFNVKSKIPELKAGIKFITVGRLTEKKGHARILKILSRLEISFKYTIIGEGQEKNNIVELAKELNLIDNINYIPFTEKVNEYLTSSHIYLQGSFVEGFPNALIESISVGTPAIVFNAPGGMNEIMLNGENGYLVDNEEIFIEKLNSIVTNINDFTPSKVSAEVRRKYNAEQIISQYEGLFDSLLSNNS